MLSLVLRHYTGPARIVPHAQLVIIVLQILGSNHLNVE